MGAEHYDEEVFGLLGLTIASQIRIGKLVLAILVMNKLASEKGQHSRVRTTCPVSSGSEPGITEAATVTRTWSNK
ncbi:hypothetical protein BDW66DRAFT_134793 [Aspergillus desertorum]